MPVKTVSWRQQSEPLYRRPTTSPQMSLKPQIPLDQKTNQMQSRSPTARVPSLSMAQTVKRQYLMKIKLLPPNTPQPLRPLQHSNVYNLIARPPPTESLHTKKTTTVTRKKRAKRTTWSRRPLLPVTLSLSLILEGTTVPQRQKALGHQRPAPAAPVMQTVPMTMVRGNKRVFVSEWNMA